jgi:hypothetical protein
LLETERRASPSWVEANLFLFALFSSSISSSSSWSPLWKSIPKPQKKKKRRKERKRRKRGNHIGRKDKEDKSCLQKVPVGEQNPPNGHPKEPSRK